MTRRSLAILTLMLGCSPARVNAPPTANSTAPVAPTASASTTAVAAGDDAPSTCTELRNHVGTPCPDRIYEGDKRYPWRVTRAGTYKITVRATGKSPAMRLWPKIVVLADDKEIASAENEVGKDSVAVTHRFETGTYVIVIGDVSSSHIAGLPGGVGLVFAIERD